LILILLPCSIVLWARRLVPVIKIATEFTIANSITLSLTTLPSLSFRAPLLSPQSQRPWVYVAIENFSTAI
jgi:hypothetical protein